MAPAPVLTVEHLSKHYRLGPTGGYRRLTEVLTGALTRSPSQVDREVRALEDVSFEVSEGEVLGIVGRNGAGKSTLLKVLSRITQPTSGRAVVRGRVGSLLEVGTGFHPELTGRENVYLNGTVLGMRRPDIDRRFDEIVEFAEVQRFLDTPVKRYSSGMYVRLAFAVAAHLEPDVLVIDEVLAVGDAAFQKKCLGKIGDVARSGRTVLFVSHSMGAVRSLCTRALLLEYGAIATEGSTEAVVSAYAASVGRRASMSLRERTDRQGSGRVVMTGFRIEGQHGAADLQFGEPGAIVVDFEAPDTPAFLQASIGLFAATGEGALYVGTDLGGAVFDRVPRAGSLRCAFPQVQLVPGTYTLNLYLNAGAEILDWIQDAATVTVADGDFFGSGRKPPAGYGSVAVEHAWLLESS